MPRHELKIYSYPHNLQNRVNHIRQFPDRPIIAQSKNVDEYVDAVFNGVSASDVYVQSKTRPREGLNAHFDTYNRHTYNHHGNQLLHDDHPFVATFNTDGGFFLNATPLSEALARDYDTNYPDQTRKARNARHHLGDYALNNPNAHIFSYPAQLGKKSGIIIPQVPGGPYVVHEITPSFRVASHAGNYSGSFLKFLVPDNTDEAREKIESTGYIRFSDYTAKRERDRKMQQEWLDDHKNHIQHLNNGLLDDIDGIDDIDELPYD